MSQFSRRNLITAGSSLTLAAAIGLVRPAFAQEQGDMIMADAFSVMSADPRLTTWTQLISAGGLESYARAPRPFTMLPAADTAFAQFPGMVKQLLGYQYQTGSHNSADAFPDTSRIVKVVRTHTINGKHFANEVMGKKLTVTSVAGTPVIVDGTNPAAVRVTWQSAANGQTMSANIVDAPIVCTNAVLYIVDVIETM